AKQEKEESEKQLAGFGIAYDEEIENLALTNGESKSSKTSGPMLIYSNKNGMVGKAYDYLVEDICDFEHKIIEITGISDIGLKYDPLLREISGTPSQAGEFELTLQYTREESDAIHDNVKLCFFILPDPQSMWKNVEPPADSLFKKAHFESLHETFHENRIYGGSLRGRSHAHAGTFRDDDFTIGIVSPDCLVLAVADGAGSAEFSREGSRIACDRVLDVARKAYADKSESLWQMLEDMQVEMSHEIKQKVSSELHLTIGEMVKSSIEGIEESAAQYEHSIRQYATTLLFAIVFKLEENYFIATYSIGDGAIGLVNDDTFKLLSSPDSGEFSGQTMFLTMKDSLVELNDRTKFSYLENLNGLCLMTDGISDPKFGTDSNLRKAEKWQELIGDVTTAGFCGAEYNEELFENWLGFFSKGDHDDRTIVFIA
ncbi:protein phosphatase 2C domain-containing protein, partial [Saprospiraceae bacterium]|nr:protein phosphatase 2C domain-containing protein [Saprospiraceae bacterium]